MPESLAVADDAARSRVRRIVPTILLIIITAMIVRDIVVRRWSSATPPAADVTPRSP